MEYPRLRYIDAFPVDTEDGRRIHIRDPLNCATAPLLLTGPAYFIVSQFDGQHTLLETQEAYARQYQRVLASDQLRDLIRQLDEHYYLDSPRFARRLRAIREEFRRTPVRAMAHADTCYSSQRQEFLNQLDGYFAGLSVPGMPPAATGQAWRPVRGLVAPHIDLRVGGDTYAHAYKALADGCDADLFIVLGTSHHGTDNLFVSTLKHYDTPLGPVATDEAFIQTLQAGYREDLFTDEILHRTEHSLEFQMLFLQYLFGGKREFSVVPILVSSFQHFILAHSPPAGVPRVAEFLRSVKSAVARTNRRVCYVAGVDFAHVGQKFGDHGELSQDVLDWVEAEDRQLIRALERVDHHGFFEQIAKDGDRRRVCGFSPMYVMLALLDAVEGRLLKYDRSIETTSQSSVSFASVAFY